MQDADNAKEPMKAEQEFAKFLKRIRKEANVYLEQLAEGLMTASQLARIEKGQRPLPKNVRDRLLGRMGIASDLYENLLNIEDYAAWECQRDILRAVEQRETQKAWKLIIAYENQAPKSDKIKRQFCLMMEAEVLKQQKVDWGDIAACYEKAVKCTVPDIRNLCIEKKLLSIQEINAVLEYEFYHRDHTFSEKCKKMMAFVKSTLYDDLSKVKIYPKIAYYYLQVIFGEHVEPTSEDMKDRLRICNQAIEMLRDTGRAYFLLELLEMKVRILECMGEKQEENGQLKQEYQESADLAKLLAGLSAEYHVPAYMQDCTYLYQQRWVFYIGDVLRIRRKMYGLTQKQLCEDVCSPRTLRRTEKKEANMQHEYLDVLLRRLGLSKEFQRSRIVTTDREALKLRDEILVCRNNQEFGKCRELLSQMREKMSLAIPENQQYMIDLEASLDWREGKISKEEFSAREEKALSYTLNLEKLVYTKEMYLTEMEVSCIRNKLHGLEDIEKIQHIDFLLHFFKLYENQSVLSDCIAMYEYVIIYIVNELGNMGKHQDAIKLNKKVLVEDLACNRIWLISNTLYEIAWNEMKQGSKMKQEMDKEKMAECLNQCIILSHFCRQTVYENFYIDKLHQL